MATDVSCLKKHNAGQYTLTCDAKCYTYMTDASKLTVVYYNKRSVSLALTWSGSRRMKSD